MRIAPDSPVHLTYCTNVHGGESWTGTFENLKQYVPAVKQQVCPDAPFGVGLRLSAIAASELRKAPRLEEFTAWLRQNELYVFTLNGFPYGRFHAVPVKDSVYAPDWRDQARVTYTLDLIHLLSHLLPDRVPGSISTLPASYKPWFRDEEHSVLAQQQSAENLAAIAMHLWKLEQATGKLIRVGLEPEPDGLVEDTDELIAYFRHWLVPATRHKAQQQRVSAGLAEEIAHRYLGICFDTCHASVQYESPQAALAKLAASGIAVTKVQVSSALKARWQSGPERQQVSRLLEELSDPVYLHQVRERAPNGSMRRFTDLPDALGNPEAPPGAEWRIHFHVPVFLEKYGLLWSTHKETAECIRIFLEKGACDHFEIETYTWDVLPTDLQTGLVHSIAQEFDWTARQMYSNHFRKKCEEQRS
jgi:hypothetical protein